MSRLFVSTLGPTDWRWLLADPAIQWERYKSALKMAECREADFTTGQRGATECCSLNLNYAGP